MGDIPEGDSSRGDQISSFAKKKLFLTSVKM